MSSSLADLWSYLRDTPSRHDIAPHELSRLAFTIFRRRAVDLFRGPASRWARVTDVLPEEVASDAQTEKRVLMKQVLRITVAELADMPREDRTLLAMATGLSNHSKRPLNARDRQRLHRIRVRLATAIRAQLGEEVASLIGEDV